MRLRSASLEAYPLWRGRMLFLAGGICVGLALCGYNVADNSAMGQVGLVFASFSPFTLVTLVCGTIPVLSFWAEHRATQRARAEHPELA